MSPRRALVTGITGQDGSYLGELLAAEGLEVHGLVRPGDPLRDQLLALVPEAILHEGDLASTDDIGRVVADSAPEEIYHLAAASSVAKSWEDPIGAAEFNGIGAVRVLDAVRRFGDASGTEPRVLLASSADMFGQPEVSPQNERTLIKPVSPYGAAKAFAHTMAGVCRAQGLFASTVILYNHESPRRPEAFVTRKITMAAARLAAGIGGPLELGNISARRDWGFAGDYVRAMRSVIRAESPDDFVVATGASHSIEDFVAAAFAAAGLSDWRAHVTVDKTLLRANDPASLVGDASKARTELGWSPDVDFQELVAMMVSHDMQLVAQQ